MKALKAKKQILASRIAQKRTQNNEQQLTQSLALLFKNIEKEVLQNLEEYWSDNYLLQGQIQLIKQPIQDNLTEYQKLLQEYIKREYQLGLNEGERIVQLHTPRNAQKSIRKKIVNYLHNKNNLFGTLEEAEERLITQVLIVSTRTFLRIDNQINQILTDGYRSGNGIRVVANDITKRFNQLETWEANRIARTEIHNAHNNAIMTSYQNLGVEYTQWKAADDDRTRESHIEIDGEIIPMGGTYSNGLSYPGDTNGDIEEWINCRCSHAPFVMPKGMMAPPDMEQFREEDLIIIS